jgi:polyhydroxybutyrate depolymerase
MTRALGFSLLLAVLALACKQPPPEKSMRFPEPGNYPLEIARPGGSRSFSLHLPPRYAERGPLPVLIAFHGGGGNGSGFQRNAKLDARADELGYAVVYPDGSGRFGRRFLTWNAGDCCGYAMEHEIDDVGFTLAILADLARDLRLDPTRVYATGHSNGAMMAYRLAADASTHIAAIVPVSGADVTVDFAPAAPVSVLHVHSVDDPRALYAGGQATNLWGGGKKIVHRPVAAGLERWRKRDACTGEGHEIDARTSGAHTAALLDFGPCADGTDVELWRLKGPGHGWPGSRSLLGEKLMGPDTEVLHVADEIFRFVARFTRPDAPEL